MSGPKSSLIDGEMMARFMASKGLKGECPTCGKLEWTVVSEPDEVTLWAMGSFRTNGSVVQPAAAIPVVVLVCGNCFTTRQHAFAGVLRWLNDETDKAAGKTAQGSANG